MSKGNGPISSQGLKAELLDRNIGVYDFRMAFFLCLFFCATLWWIPYLGPAIAGYICGRKSGSMVKGVICAAIAGAIVLAIIWGLSFVYTDGAIGTYIGYYFNDEMTQINYSLYVVLLLFAFIGGVMTRQVRRETADLLLLGATETPIRPVARSVQLYEKNKELGFECFDDCISTQRMVVNETEVEARKAPEIELAPGRTAKKPITNTVQTVTSVVSEYPTSTEEDESRSPFDNILNRSERGKK